MKLKNKIIFMLLVSITTVAGITGCKKDSFDINKNPNQATDSTISYNVILPSALNSQAATLATSWGWLQNWLGFWARSGTYAPNRAEETYEVTTSFQAGIWTSLYDNNYDYQTMQIQATKAGADYYAGIARIMKSLNYGILVDLYNNVPYSQALKAGANTTPKYDKGLDIYNDLFRQIDTGIALIQNADVSSTGPNKSILTDDVMFGTSSVTGQTTANQKILWSKFANTLKLRLLIHCTSGGVLVPNATVTGINHSFEFARLSAGSFKVGTLDVTNYGYLGAGENAQVNPGFTNTATAKMNPFYYTYVANNAGTATANSQYYRANSFAIEYYSYNGDARMQRIYGAGNQGYRGVAYGLPSLTSNAAAELSPVGGPGLNPPATSTSPLGTKPQWLFTATESLFLQAEAIHRGFLPGNAKTTLNAAITESFSFLGAAGASLYIANNAGYPDVDYSGVSQGTGLPAGGLFTIISQKWFALNAIAPYEVYTDYRRVNMRNRAGAAVDRFIYAQGALFAPSSASGYPSTTVGPPISVSPSNTTTQIPSRLLYPQNEYNYNPTNVGLEGAISKNGKVFWDN